MKKIINPWEGLDGYMCFGCAPSNPMGLHMEFYEDGDDIVAYWEPEAHYQGWSCRGCRTRTGRCGTPA